MYNKISNDILLSLRKDDLRVKYISLSDTEMDILKLLWEADHALSRPEILERLDKQDWNPNSIHQVLNSMMKKAVLKVEGHTLCGKIYGRTYAPAMTQTQFLSRRIAEATGNMNGTQRLLGVFASMIEHDDISAETVSQLEAMLQKRKEELKNK